MNAASPRHAGFSFAEVLIGAGIMIAIAGACLGVQLATTNLMGESAARSVLEERAIFAAKEVAFETRWCDGGALVMSKSNGSDRLDLCTALDYVAGVPVWSPTITYQVLPSPNDGNANGILDEGQLVRTQGGATRVICDHVVPGGFTATRVDDNVTFEVHLLGRHLGRPVAVTAATSTTIRN